MIKSVQPEVQRRTKRLAKETVDGKQLLLDQRGLGGGRICGGSLWAQNGGEGEADLRCTSVGRPRKDIRADKSTGRVSDLLSMELFRMSMILLSVYDSSQLAPLEMSESPFRVRWSEKLLMVRLRS